MKYACDIVRAEINVIDLLLCKSRFVILKEAINLVSGESERLYVARALQNDNGAKITHTLFKGLKLSRLKMVIHDTNSGCRY